MLILGLIVLIIIVVVVIAMQSKSPKAKTVAQTFKDFADPRKCIALCKKRLAACKEDPGCMFRSHDLLKDCVSGCYDVAKSVVGPTLGLQTASPTPCEQACNETTSECRNTCPAPHLNRTKICRDECQSEGVACQVNCRALG